MPRTARRGTKRSEDYEEKPLSQIAGYVAGDPEVRDGSEGDEFTTFRVGSNRFYDDENPDATRWYSIAINSIWFTRCASSALHFCYRSGSEICSKDDRYRS